MIIRVARGRDAGMLQRGMAHGAGDGEGAGRAEGTLAARAQAMMSWEEWETSQDAVHG